MSGALVDNGNGTYSQRVRLDGSGAGGSAVTVTQVNSGNSVTSDQNAVIAAATGLRLFGYSVREDTGTAGAVLQIKHGTTGAGGTLVESISLQANESTADYWGPEGVDVAASGVSIDWVSGSFKMSLKSKVVS